MRDDNTENAGNRPGPPHPLPDDTGTAHRLWPSGRYHELVDEMATYIGHSVYLSMVTFTGAFAKEGRPYRLLDLAPFPNPRDHPHPCKRTYPHMLVLESVRPEGWPDEYWRNGIYHGGAVNLAHVGSVTTTAFPERTDQFLYANLGLLAWYYGKPARSLLAEGIVPERVVAGGDYLPGA